MEAKPKTSSNRNPIKQWAITYPQCKEMTKESFAKMWPPHDEMIIAQEEHEDGGLHLHMGIKLKKGLSKSKILKWIEKWFPNDYKRIQVQGCKNWSDWVNYCKKEDPEPVEDSLKLCKISRKEKDKKKEKMYKQLEELKQWDETANRNIYERENQKKIMPLCLGNGCTAKGRRIVECCEKCWVCLDKEYQKRGSIIIQL